MPQWKSRSLSSPQNWSAEPTMKCMPPWWIRSMGTKIQRASYTDRLSKCRRFSPEDVIACVSKTLHPPNADCFLGFQFVTLYFEMWWLQFSLHHKIVSTSNCFALVTVTWKGRKLTWVSVALFSLCGDALFSASCLSNLQFPHYSEILAYGGKVVQDFWGFVARLVLN